jgi:hypothetical protein
LDLRRNPPKPRRGKFIAIFILSIALLGTTRGLTSSLDVLPMPLAAYRALSAVLLYVIGGAGIVFSAEAIVSDSRPSKNGSRVTWRIRKK